MFRDNDNWDDIPLGVRLRRQRFCHEYIKDFNGSKAMMRLGSKSATPWVHASEWLKEPFTQWYLRKLLDEADEKAIVSRNEVLAGLKAEAHHFGMDGSSAARSSAWRSLAKILGMEITKIDGEVTMNGGVMLVPAGSSTEEWEKNAAKAQAELKQDVRK